MKAIYTKEPLQIELIKKYNDKIVYMLRKNIISSTITNPLTNKSINSWNCDELLMETYNKDNIENDIKNNFDAYYALAEKEYQNKLDLENKKEQTKKLIDGGIYQQIGLNNIAGQQLNDVNNMVNQFIEWYFQKHPDET